MAGQNRSSYARSHSSANRGVAAFFRGAFILLVALTLSFGLGFFVIARMVPTTAADAAAGSGAGGAQNIATPGPTHGQNRSPASNAPQAASIPSKPAQDGPEILPENSVQTPDKPGAEEANSNANIGGESGLSEQKSHGDNKADSEAPGSASTNATAADDGSNTASPGQKRSHRTTPTGTDIGTVQHPGSPDSTTADAADPARATPTPASAPAKTGVYRVQIGVYSTREKAEEVARNAADKGIATTVHVIKREGLTLYRVQQSTHRDRAKAETDRQKLLDAGFDATIINPS